VLKVRKSADEKFNSFGLLCIIFCVDLDDEIKFHQSDPSGIVEREAFSEDSEIRKFFEVKISSLVNEISKFLRKFGDMNKSVISSTIQYCSWVRSFLL
jgi:hypothetical protein